MDLGTAKMGKSLLAEIEHLEHLIKVFSVNGWVEIASYDTFGNKSDISRLNVGIPRHKGIVADFKDRVEDVLDGVMAELKELR